MADEVMDSIADDAPVESIADETPKDGAETAQDARGGEQVQSTAPATDSAPEGQQDAQKQDAPEDYKFEPSEDFNVPQENLDSFAKACKDAKLSKAQAEALLNWHKQFAGDVSRLQQAQQDQQIRAWQGEIMQDKEFGGPAWKATVADSRKALAAFDPQGELRQLLKAAHVDYHPAVVRCIARVGRAMGEDKFITGKGRGNANNVPLEDRLWPDMIV